jgi:KaiC/GvpD/RAD55 family RecA-like ATPase
VKSVSEAIRALTFNDSIPTGLTLLLGATGVGKTIFSQQLVFEMLRDQGKVLWITTEELPSSIRASMSRFGWNIDRHEQAGRLLILDAVSQARLGLSENIGRGILGLDPTGMLIAVSEQLRQEPANELDSFLIVIDSVSRLLLSCDPKSVIDFVACLSSRLENFKARGLATVAEGAHEERILNALTFSATGTIRFRINEIGDLRIHQFRIEALRGKRHDDKWKNYTITNTGLDMEI